MFFILVAGKELACTKEARIIELEEQIRQSKARFMTTSNGGYGGAGPTLECFDTSAPNLKKLDDLMPCPRRPAKK